MDTVFYVATYLFIGLVILCYDVATDERCEEHLSEHGVLLIALMLVGWPIFLGMVFADWGSRK